MPAGDWFVVQSNGTVVPILCGANPTVNDFAGGGVNVQNYGTDLMYAAVVIYDALGLEIAHQATQAIPPGQTVGLQARVGSPPFIGLGPVTLVVVNYKSATPGVVGGTSPTLTTARCMVTTILPPSTQLLYGVAALAAVVAAGALVWPTVSSWFSGGKAT